MEINLEKYKNNAPIEGITLAEGELIGREIDPDNRLIYIIRKKDGSIMIEYAQFCKVMYMDKLAGFKSLIK